MSLCLKDVSASQDMVLRAPAQYLGHAMDIPVVAQPQVPMFPKVKSTTEIPQVPFMMVHRWLPSGTEGSISQLCHNTKYQRSRRYSDGRGSSNPAAW